MDDNAIDTTRQDKTRQDTSVTRTHDAAGSGTYLPLRYTTLRYSLSMLPSTLDLVGQGQGQGQGSGGLECEAMGCGSEWVIDGKGEERKEPGVVVVVVVVCQ